MTITVKLFATYRAGRFKVEEQDYPAGTTCAGIATAVGLDPAGIGIILVNGRHAEADQQLQDGDVLALFPLVGGG
jgi:molybdopterin converting factor small subunit